MYPTGHYSEALDAYYDAANECWSCAQCLGVLGSIGCCRYRAVGPAGVPDFAPPAPAHEPDPPSLLPQLPPPGPAHRPTPVELAQGWRERFEVRGVDETRRRLFYLDDARRYVEACLIADVARHLFRHHVVVWDAVELRILYDSREMASKWPWGLDVDSYEDLAPS